MKYLESFGSSTNNNMKDLKRFCQDHLAFLIDEGFSISENTAFAKSTYIIINKPVNVKDNSNNTTHSSKSVFQWETIKDHFIPFIHFLNKEYDIYGFIEFDQLDRNWNRTYPNKNYEKVSYTIKEILNDDRDLNQIAAIRNISIRINK